MQGVDVRSGNEYARRGDHPGDETILVAL